MPSLVLIFAVFLIISIKVRFLGVRRLPTAFKKVFASAKSRGTLLSSFCLSLSATVGTGNIAGVAGAVTLGGPGAVFWMWISALLAMSVKFYEVYLSSLYKKKGSAHAYIYAVIKNKLLRNAFLCFGIVAAFGIGNLTQTNTAAAAAVMAFEGTLPRGAARIFVGLIFAVLVAALLRHESFAVSFCEKFLPFMAAAYILFCITALIISRADILEIFIKIIKGAFCPRAVTGGAVGSTIVSIRSGVARGIFSNEAGLSTAALAYEKSQSTPEDAALFSAFEVFIDTIVLCTLTAFVLLSSDAAVYGEDMGAYTTLCAFINILGRKTAGIFCVIMSFFAFSSVIGWGVYARRFSSTLGLSSRVITVVYAAGCVAGAVLKVAAVWQIAEIGCILMMSLNCTALLSSKKTPNDFSKNA